MATGNTIEESTTKLQLAADNIATWTRKWRIKLNETKSTYISFTNQKINQRSVSLNGVRIPPANTAEYLGMALDAKLRWKEHIKKKPEELEIKFRKMSWLIGRRSELSMYKLLLYKQMLRPVWTYGAQLWGCAKQCNIEVIQRYQNKVLRRIADAPCTAAKDGPEVVWMEEENAIPFVVLGTLCNFLSRISSWRAAYLYVCCVALSRALLVQVTAPTPHTTGRLLAVGPDMAELLAVVTLRETSLGCVRLFPDCSMAKDRQFEHLMGL
ncbi:hypothetical protein B7P43_G03721 [Cryptotermes secundus]|uniref:Reverse transcriptase domain-containing protein n=1 Tax=Cryptotermes secundus TaxID=105785 RepID=A0A2J7R3Y8_9NEOP|nr:hypothetical protein B7P43_G03721 [Cryptotermes secundus]